MVTGVCFPKGFATAGIAAGLKASGGKDLALVVNEGILPAAAAVFTSNRVEAEPVKFSRAQMRNGVVTHVLLNSGNANACTGEQGRKDVEACVNELSLAAGVDQAKIAVCSTGVIGEYLDTAAITRAIPALVSGLEVSGATSAASAIMTTDTVPKEVQIEVDGWRVGGMAKGAGMLAPALATMLCVITTDAVIDNEALDSALRHAVQVSFNRLDTDGCMSTNDTVIVLASGESGITPDEATFATALEQACTKLAKMLRDDAEGAEHFVDITVSGASSEAAAVEVARAVSRSNLVKTAIFGNDPNWGRILSQIGTVPSWVAPFDVGKVNVSINGVMICKNGSVGDPKESLDLAAAQEVKIEIDLGAGNSSATVYTTDLTHAYVHENSAYTS
ncbi:bifunctional glutamate N-acetyltransferase/amino-acid acetyltransferase ArgJ [Actinomyces sp.]|uniref:bifunctional glutamate N-acetyltransferase/amino-acid acetyltransferase ArgJ n=1 Tax=Actinomyces sp. TaxID=29317 RepID=UPI002912597C|nr:bifunctional glutamate N-acetyltransferase/amino-acid acetyltransferase ArgJ [Actinomyces sp.]MDU5569162.1 bifunctional glutamate N-acetyltransferase/amino-acid acetyltransferase ArgJ [Actinomyces sp.]